MKYDSRKELIVRYHLYLLLKKLGLKNETIQNVDKYQVLTRLSAVQSLVRELRGRLAEKQGKISI